MRARSVLASASDLGAANWTAQPGDGEANSDWRAGGLLAPNRPPMVCSITVEGRRNGIGCSPRRVRFVGRSVSLDGRSRSRSPERPALRPWGRSRPSVRPRLREGGLAGGCFAGEPDLTARSIRTASFVASGSDTVGGLGASVETEVRRDRRRDRRAVRPHGYGPNGFDIGDRAVGGAASEPRLDLKGATSFHRGLAARRSSRGVAVDGHGRRLLRRPRAVSSQRESENRK